ncbi:hypothetical protein JF50_18565 [Pseudoalteromonas luteoviolacea]|uniref:PKD/Chitinase domain-containing protein n=1 Tax=Pseudoalteromonas luteoviolacea TaxID=43657 RepID=A0A0C1QMH9_9GAMM|nr:hypothetical protein [Pseudoalteromonas luteoviolacea]KID56262.1 hypothetical protein JF50_18565 [Pseudoalteromonas luteoviolacea]
MFYSRKRMHLLYAWVLGISLVGCGGGGSDSGSPSTPSNPSTPQNSAPTVTVSGENSIQEKQQISLTAQASDSDGTVNAFAWEIVSGPSAALSNAATNTVTFTAPDVTEDTAMTLRVTVTDDDGATANANFNLNITRIVKSVTITGLVTDEPIPNAALTIFIGDQSFELSADETGTYNYTLDIDDSMVDDLVRIRAKGGSSQSEVEFYSQLPSFSSIETQAGEDGILNKDDNFGVNITNVTTSEYALITREVGTPQSETSLNNALVGIDADEKLTLAALIKIVVDGEGDNAFSLPEGVNSTFELVSTPTAVTELTDTINDKNPTLIDSTKNNIKEDDDLVDNSQSNIIGDYLIGSTKVFSQLFYEASFNQDNTGTFADYSSGGMTWSQNEEGLVSLVFESGIMSKTYRCKGASDQEYDCQYRYKSGSFSIYDENPIAKAISITFIGDEFTMDSTGNEMIVNSDVSRNHDLSMIGKTQTITPLQSQLSGDWYINALYYSVSGSFASKVTFNQDGTGSAQMPDDTSRSLTWSITDNILNLTLDKTDLMVAKTFKYWLIRSLDSGYQFWATTDKTDTEHYRRRSGLMVPEQAVTLTNNDVIGRFRAYQGVAEPQNFFVDNYINGTSYRFMYKTMSTWAQSGRTLSMQSLGYGPTFPRPLVHQCPEGASADMCVVNWTQKLEVIAQNGDTWYVRESYPTDNSYTTSGSYVQQYKKSASTVDKFEYYWLPNRTLYFVENQQVLDNFFSESQNDDGSTSRKVKLGTGDIADYSISEGKLLIDQMGSVGVTEIQEFDRDYFKVCGYFEGTNCELGEVRNLFVDPNIASRSMYTPPAPMQYAIDGAWYQPNSPEFVIVIRDGTWVHMELKTDNDPQGFAGLEIGSLSWDESTGTLLVNKVVDTNGVYGFDENLAHKATVNGNTMTLEVEGESPITFERLLDENDPRVGGFVEYPLTTSRVWVSVFLPGNKFFEAEYDPANSDGPGINYGAYSYNEETGLATLTFEVNQLNTDDISFFMYQAGPDVIHWKDMDEVGAVVRTKSNSEQPYFDSHKIEYERFALINGDDTYYIDFKVDGTADFVSNGQTRSFTWKVVLGQLHLTAVTPSAGLQVEAYVITPTSMLDDGWNVDVIKLEHPLDSTDNDSPDNHSRFSGSMRR